MANEQPLQDQKSNNNFSKIPHFVVDQGLLRILKRSEMAIYLVLHKHANFNTDISYPSVIRISELTGCGRGVVAKATDRLAELNLIEKIETRVRGLIRNSYRIIRDPEMERPACPSSTDKPKRMKRGNKGKFLPGSVPGIKTARGEMSSTCPSSTDKPFEFLRAPNARKSEKQSNDLSVLVVHNLSVSAVHDLSVRHGHKREIYITKDKERERGAPVPLSVLLGSEIQQFIINNFEQIYTDATGISYSRSSKDLVLMDGLIKKHGPDAVQKKISLLKNLCLYRDTWFASNGMADFSIQNLANNWNQITPQARKYPN